MVSLIFVALILVSLSGVLFFESKMLEAMRSSPLSTKLNQSALDWAWAATFTLFAALFLLLLLIALEALEVMQELDRGVENGQITSITQVVAVLIGYPFSRLSLGVSAIVSSLLTFLMVRKHEGFQRDKK